MSSIKTCLILSLLLLAFGATAHAQEKAEAVAPYKLSEMKVLSFNRMDNTLKEIETDNFFNEVDLEYLVKVEVSGKGGSIATPLRSVEIIVFEGKKQSQKKVTAIGILNEQGKYYVPLWMSGQYCNEEVTIQARLLGQQQPSLIKKTLSFQCGE